VVTTVVVDAPSFGSAFEDEEQDAATIARSPIAGTIRQRRRAP